MKKSFIRNPGSQKKIRQDLEKVIHRYMKTLIFADRE